MRKNNFSKAIDCVVVCIVVCAPLLIGAGCTTHNVVDTASLIGTEVRLHQCAQLPKSVERQRCDDRVSDGNSTEYRTKRAEVTGQTTASTAKTESLEDYVRRQKEPSRIDAEQ